MTVRKLKNATITHVSYVDKGANKKQFFMTKSADSPPTFEKDVKVLINKEDDEQKLVYGVVYEPDELDAHNDFMEASDIEKAAHTFLAEYRNIDKQHDFQKGYGEVVESYVAPQDFEVGGETIAKGSWVLVTKADDETWESIKKGEITGYSMAGTAEVEEVEKNAEETQMQKFFNGFKNFFTKGEFTDAYNATTKRRNLFDALWMFEDFVIDELYRETPDANKLQELAQELGNIMSQVANSTDIVKELKNDIDNKEEIQMKKEDLQNLLKEAIDPINEKLASMEADITKGAVAEGEEVEKKEGNEEEVEKNEGTEDIAKQLEDILKEQLAPINERLDKVEKARGISKSAEANAEGQEGEEEESVFKSLFEFKGQL